MCWLLKYRSNWRDSSLAGAKPLWLAQSQVYGWQAHPKWPCDHCGSSLIVGRLTWVLRYEYGSLNTFSSSKNRIMTIDSDCWIFKLSAAHWIWLWTGTCPPSEHWLACQKPVWLSKGQPLWVSILFVETVLAAALFTYSETARNNRKYERGDQGAARFFSSACLSARGTTQRSRKPWSSRLAVQPPRRDVQLVSKSAASASPPLPEKLWNVMENNSFGILS